MVNSMKPLIIQTIGGDLVGKTRAEARSAIDDYFSQIVWSLEKDEWERMSEAEKSAFADFARQKQAPSS